MSTSGFASYVVGVDSGGTFTDCVAIADDGTVARSKAASTPADYSLGVIRSVERVAEALGTGLRGLLARTVLFAHGTTVATNALLTRSGSPTGMLTTRGHEDAIVIGRTYQKVAGLSDDEMADVASLDKAVPLVPPGWIHGVQERVDARGTVVSPLDPDSVRLALDSLVAGGVDSVAVVLLWSFLNPVHEQAVRELVAAEYPQLSLSLSHELAPVIGEYERSATTMVNAYVMGPTRAYLAGLRRRLAEEGYLREPVVMQSSGGVLSAARVMKRPVGLLTSGPSGGVIGAQVLGSVIGYENVITTDVGGTSFDVGLVVSGSPQFSDVATFQQYQLSLPAIDVATIGAGGGSIAWLEPDTGVLRVGPRSAGAEPGPACYGIGGTEATVTDANVVLGRINPSYFLGGERELSADFAWEAVERIAIQLGLGVPETAAGIVDIADAHMADLVRRVTVERGYDPREFVVFAFGGAGPLHAAAFGATVGARRVVVPTLASVFSAFGIAGSDAKVVEELSEPFHAPFPIVRFQELFDQLETTAVQELVDDGIAAGQISCQRFVRLRYRGQVHEVETPVPPGAFGEPELAQTLRTFEQLYEAKFGRGTTYARAGLQAMTFSVHARGLLNPPALVPHPPAEYDVTQAIKETRPVWFGARGEFAPTAIYAAERLGAGHQIAGPAIVEAFDTTIVVPTGHWASVDPHLNLVIEVAE